MAKPVVLTAIAEQDLEAITDYLTKNWNRHVALAFLNHFEQCCLVISIFPAAFPIINKKRKIRKCVLTRQNTIYYKEKVKIVEILSIFDTRQDPSKIKFS